MDNFYASYPVEGGTGVTSLNGLTGALTLVAGSGITITPGVPGASDITISATGAGFLADTDGLYLLKNTADNTKTQKWNLSGQTTATALTIAPLNTSNMTLNIPQVATAGGTGMALVQDETTGFIFGYGITSSIGAANSMFQLANATVANRAQIKLHSYFNGASVAGVSTLTSRSGVIGTNTAVVAGQDYSKWTAQAAATTPGSAPISGTFSFKANSVNSLTVPSDFHLQLTNLAGTLADRLYLTSEGLLQLPGYTAGAAVFDGSGNVSSVAPGTSGNVLTSNGTTWVSQAAPTSGITQLTGDVTAGPGSGSQVATIAPLAVTNSKIANATIDLTAKVTNVLPAANGGAPPVTKNLYVDNLRTDSFTPDGSFGRPFATIGAAITQIITNADNSTHPYTVNVTPGAYSETLTFNSATLYNIVFTSTTGSSTSLQNTTVSGITSTSNNTQLSTLVFNGFTVNGNLNLTGDTNGTNFGSSQILFSNCQFNNSSGTIVLNNVNNVNFYGCQIQGTGSVSTFTNVAFAYVEGAEGFISGTTLHLVQNNSGNQPSQSTGNYLLFSESKCYATVTIDAGSEMDSLLSYFGSGSSVTNNGVIHSWQTGWNGTVTANSGSTTRVQGDVFLTAPTINGGATFTLRGNIYGNSLNVASPVTVPNGGTGDASFTPYSVVCGGTTSTGNLQNVSGVGTSGQVLTSNGASALPTWQAASGSTFTGSSYYLSTTQSSFAGGNVPFDTSLFDTNSAYNTSTHTYTAAATGRYNVSFYTQAVVSGSVTSDNVIQNRMELFVNGTNTCRVGNSATFLTSADGPTVVVTGGSVIIALNSSDALTFHSTISAVAGTLSSHDLSGGATPRVTYFSIEYMG